MEVITFQLSGGQQCLIDRADWETPYTYVNKNDGYTRAFAPCSKAWQARGTGKWLYATTCLTSTKRRYYVHLHHAVLGPPPKGFVTDHINGNRFDNRRCNLRHCTNAENVRNAHAKPKGGSRFKGVYQNATSRKWRAQIGFKGRRIRIGEFATEIEAAVAYNLKAQELFGEFASLNPIPEAPATQTLLFATT